jgi:serine protease Do
LKDIIKEAEEATFIIYTYDEFGSPNGSGSGFFIDANGSGITNYHVLDGSVKAVIKTADETEYEIGRVVASDKKWDIVKFTIKSERSDFKFLKFAKTEIVKGDVVYNISSPMGLEKTVSDGIVSSLREDKQHGDIVQVTAPISPGSSGSPILDKNGNVIAVATLIRRGGQNLNFGVKIDDARLAALEKNDFAKANKKFNSQSDFIILNMPSDKGADIVLNAVEFGESVTTLYLSYTHLNIVGGDTYYVWCELNKKDKGFTLVDLDTGTDYYVTSSTLGVDKKNGTKIELATTMKFKVYLPAIKRTLGYIDIYGC